MEKKDEVWQVVSSKYLFRRPWLTVRCDDMLLPNGNHIPEYYILEYPDWVNTIAITKEGKFVFVRQFRPGIGKQLYDRIRQRQLERVYGNFGQSEYSYQSDTLLSGY